MILHCDFDLEDIKPVILKDNLAHDDASPYQLWSLKVQRFRRYFLKETFIEILTFCCDLGLEHNNPIYPLDTLAGDNVLLDQVW